MKEYIKLFDVPASADNYEINDIPWITMVESTEQLLNCNEEGKKIKVVNNVMTIESAGSTIEMVDLGLPSDTLWAKCNIGANIETEAGQYFQWAATTSLHIEGTTVNPAADWSLCPYTDNEGTPSKYIGSDYSTLQSTDDTATVILGANYKMPTKEQFEELIEETDNEWTSINGVNGYKFTNKNDSSKYIFLPAASCCDGSDLSNVGDEGCYWSSSLDTDNPSSAWGLYFYVKEVSMGDYCDRYCGLTVRPVRSANS